MIRLTPGGYAEYDGTHRSIGDLERSLRDVDRDDLECYLIHEDLAMLVEYARGLADLECERGDPSWTH